MYKKDSKGLESICVEEVGQESRLNCSKNFAVTHLIHCRPRDPAYITRALVSVTRVLYWYGRARLRLPKADRILL